MKNSEQLEKIRAAERESHTQIYSTAKLYEGGSWLQKPIKTVLDLLQLFQDYKELRVLDLGGGVGRNCIPIAEMYRDISCKIECVDLLEFAISRLRENAAEHKVEDLIEGIVESIENYPISENGYDLILAVSALEHIDSEASFVNKLKEIHNGLRKNGIVCLVMNSEVTETDRETGEEMAPQFEVNLPTELLLKMLDDCFAGWKRLKMTVREQQYEIPRGERIARLATKVVTYVGRNE